MRLRIGKRVALAVTAIAAQGCTTYLYKGPTRPSSEVAVVTSSDTIVDSVDDVRVRESASGSYARLEVLPGPHRLAVSLNQVTPGLFFTRVARSNDVEVCVQLEADHIYRTEAFSAGGLFSPVVVDLTARRYAPRCRSTASRPSLAAVPRPQETAPVPGQPGAPDERSADPSSAKATEISSAEDHEVDAAATGDRPRHDRRRSTWRNRHRRAPSSAESRRMSDCHRMPCWPTGDLESACL